MPSQDGLSFVHNALIGTGVRDRIGSAPAASSFRFRYRARHGTRCRIGATPPRVHVRARCIQSQSCHTDRCPTGVTTQDRTRQRALVVSDKLQRVTNFHAATIHSLVELTAAAGLDHPSEFNPHHFSRRVSGNEVMTFAQLYPQLEAGELVKGTNDLRFRDAWAMARADDFRPASNL